MSINIFTTSDINRVQTIGAFILSFLGIGWFFFLSNVVKFKTSLSLQRGNGEVPVLETIVPTTVVDFLDVLRIQLKKRIIRPVVFTSVMVMIGLILTSFEGIIAINTIHYVESCELTIVMSQAQIVNNSYSAAYSSGFEVETMMRKRNKSNVPEGILVGQIPINNLWKFNAQLDVDPYPWRSSCSLYRSGISQINMNTSVLYMDGLADLRESLPEVHAEYTFRNITNEYIYINGWTRSMVNFNKTTNTFWTNGALIMMIEEFSKGKYNEIGAKYMNRLWTFKVPETTRIPYDVKNPVITEVTTPIAVKSYTCEMERVKEGNHGGYGSIQNLEAIIQTLGGLVERNWTLAVLNGNDTSTYELKPEHWASYLAVKGIQLFRFEEVPVQLDMPCIKINPVYILLVCVHMMMMFMGGVLWVAIRNSELKVPSGVVGWANHSCKESNNNNTERDLLNYNLVLAEKDVKIILKK